jgi:FtsH-binding integral membrane protein
MFARDEKAAQAEEAHTLLGSGGGSSGTATLGAAGSAAWQLDAVLRRGFIRKVYGILAAQLTLTFGMIFLFVFVEPAKVRLCGMESREVCDSCPYFTGSSTTLDPVTTCMYTGSRSGKGLGDVGRGLCNLSPQGGCFRPTAALSSALTSAVMLSFVFILGIVCCERYSRKFPTNYIALFSFTACEAVMLAITCLFVDAVAVGLAAAMTALVTAGLTYYAWTTTADFTGAGGYLYAALLTFVVCGFVGGFFSAFYATPWVQSVYAGGGCLLFSFYIVYDTQLIVGGQHKKHQFGVDDYVFAALNIYLDIINLFIYILQVRRLRCYDTLRYATLCYAHRAATAVVPSSNCLLARHHPPIISCMTHSLLNAAD